MNKEKKGNEYFKMTIKNKSPIISSSNNVSPFSQDLSKSTTKKNIEIQKNKNILKSEGNTKINIFNEQLNTNEKNEDNFKNIILNLEKNINVINNNINSNNKSIEKLENSLNKLKQEKNNKKSEIVNLLSNKESLDELYNNYIDYLKNKNGNFIKNKKINNNLKSSPFENQDEDAFEILISEIKEIDLNKFIEQTFNFIEDIFENPTQQLKFSLKEIINKSYSLFNNSISSSPFLDTYSIVSNFFLRISLFLSNQSYGKYSETIINLFLRCLLKMNSINVKNEKLINYMNTNYKEEKGKLKQEIYSLIKKNEILEKNKMVLEKQIKNVEIKLKIGKNIESLDYNINLNSNTKETNSITNNNLNNNDIVYFRTESKNEINAINENKTQNKKKEIKEKIKNKFKKIYKEDIISTKTIEDVLEKNNLNYTEKYNDSVLFTNDSKRTSYEKQNFGYNNQIYDNFIGKINKINLYEKFTAHINETKRENKGNFEKNEKYQKYNTKSSKENQIDKDNLIEDIENNIKKYNTINNYHDFSKKNFSKKEYISPQINNKSQNYYKNDVFKDKSIKNKKILDRIYYNKKFKVISQKPKKKLNYHYYNKKINNNIISYNDINKNMKFDLAKKIKYLDKVNKTNTSSAIQAKNISKINKDKFLNEQNIKYKRLLTEKKEKKFKYNFFDIIQETNKKRNNSGENKFKNINNLISGCNFKSDIKPKAEKGKKNNFKEYLSNNKNYENIIKSDFINDRIKSYYEKSNFQINSYNSKIINNGIEKDNKYNGSDSPFGKNELLFSKKYKIDMNKTNEKINKLDNKINLEINNINDKINMLNNRSHYYNYNKNTYSNSGKKDKFKNDYKSQIFKKENNLNTALKREIKKNNIYFIITESRNNLKNNNKIFTKINKNENINDSNSKSKSNRSEFSKNKIMEKGFNSYSKTKNRISNFNFKFNKTILLKRSLSSTINKLLNNNLKKKTIIDSYNEINNNSSNNNSFNVSNSLGASYINKKGKEMDSYIDNSNKLKINKESIANLKIGLKNSFEINKDFNEKKGHKVNNIIKISNENLTENVFISLINKYKENQKETFCYFKLFSKDFKNKKTFNPLENCSINPENLGYSEGYISIDLNERVLKIIPKITTYRNTNSNKYINLENKQSTKTNYIKSKNQPHLLNNENNNKFNQFLNNNNKDNYLNIQLKELNEIEQSLVMSNIIKIHRIFIKYNSSKKNNINSNLDNNQQKSEKKVLNLNKLIYVREIKEINMPQNEKIKAILCNYFSFSFFYGQYNEKSEIELIFINFEQYNLWNNFISTIVEFNMNNNNNITEAYTDRNRINNTHNKGTIENGSNINEDISKISNNDIIINV